MTWLKVRHLNIKCDRCFCIGNNNNQDLLLTSFKLVVFYFLNKVEIARTCQSSDSVKRSSDMIHVQCQHLGILGLRQNYSRGSNHLRGLTAAISTVQTPQYAWQTWHETPTPSVSALLAFETTRTKDLRPKISYLLTYLRRYVGLYTLTMSEQSQYVSAVGLQWNYVHGFNKW